MEVKTAKTNTTTTTTVTATKYLLISTMISMSTGEYNRK